MDVLDRMIDHHLWLVGEIVDRTGQVDEAVLDRPIELSVEGGTSMPEPGETTAAGLRARLDHIDPRFRELVVRPVHEGRADETFVDAVCDPPETFTYGGIVAHVLTFAAVRRTMAIGALTSAGIEDLGSGDPMRFVGGTGTDASQIDRTPPDGVR